MVSYQDVLANNESLKDSGSGLTAVVVGGTNGIGLGTLRVLVEYTTSPTIYVVGRSPARLDSLIAELQRANPSARLIPIVAPDLTLVRDAEKAAADIAANGATKIDLLIMSAGYINFARDDSPEGLDRVTAIRFYTRMRILTSLAPLLRAAPSPRVVSVLAGGKEGRLSPADLVPGTSPSGAGTSSALTTLFFEEFARRPGNERMVLIHIFPGFVGGTGMTMHGVSLVPRLLITWLIGPAMRLFGYTVQEAGHRVLFAATNGRFRRLSPDVSADGTLIETGSDGRRGSGVYLVQGDSSVSKTDPPGGGSKQLAAIHTDSELQGLPAKVYEHTMAEFDRIGRM